MLIITDVKVYNTENDRDVYKYIVKHDTPTTLAYYNSDVNNLKMYVETIRGKRFTNERGEKVVLGASKKVQEILGIPFEVFSKCSYNELKRLEDKVGTLEKAIEEESNFTTKVVNELSYSRQKVQKYDSMSFTKRLKFLFTGKCSQD